MPNVNFYPGGGRSPLGGQVNQIPYITAKRGQITTPASARYKFAADMVRALTAKAQENREREDRDAYMAALAKEKEFDPSTMPAPEESNLLAGEREIMAQALLAGEPSLGGSALKSFPLFTASQGLIRPNVDDDPRVAEMFSDGASDRYESIERAASEGIPTGYAASPPLGTDESMNALNAEGFSGGPEALFGSVDADGASDPRMQAALIGDIGTRAGDLQRHEDELKAAEANFVGREEAIAAYAPTTKYGEKLKYGYQVDQVERDRVEREAEDERDRAADLLSRERMFKAKTAEDLAIANLLKAGVTGAAGADSALVAQYKHLNSLRENLAALEARNAPAAEISKAQQQVSDMETIIRATQYKDIGPKIVGFNQFTGQYEEIEKGLSPEQEIPHQAASAQVQKIGTLHGETIHQQYEGAKAAIINKEKIDTLFRALSKEGTETGIGAEFINDIKRLMVRISEDEGLQQEVANMESLESLMGSEVFPLIKLLGIGARGLDTPAEREFLQKVLTGTLGLNKSTLLRMAKIRMREADRAIEEWQSGINNKSRDIWYGATREPREKLSNPSSIDNRLVSVQGMSTEELEAYVHPYLPPEILKAAVERLKELQ